MELMEFREEWLEEPELLALLDDEIYVADDAVEL